MTQEKLATVVGRSRPAIANTLRLLNLPDDIKKFVMNEELTAGHARALLVLAGSAHVQIKAAEHDHRTANSASAILKSWSKSCPHRPNQQKKPDPAYLLEH